MTGPSPHEGSSPFAVTVVTNGPTYTEGQPVSFTVEVCNTGPATTTEGGGGSDIPFSLTIRTADGRVVADDSHAIRKTRCRRVT